MHTTTRRGFLDATLAFTAAAPTLLRAQGSSSAPGGTPKALSELAAVAAKKPHVVWSESSETVSQLIPVFNAVWPDIKVEFVRDTGGNTLAAKVVQEVQAGGTPASLLTGDAALFIALDKRGLLVRRDWKELGIDQPRSTPFMVATTAAMGVLLWNKQKVSDAEAPKRLDDLLAEKWTGKVGSWIRAPLYTSLAKELGEDAVRSFLTKLVTMQPRLYDSTFQLAQEVGTGEIDVAYGLYHAAQPAIAAGAPIGLGFTDSVGVTALFSTVVAKGANPEGAQVLLAWLASKEGADAYERVTKRGNPYAKGSKAAELVAGRRLSEFSADETDQYVRILTEFNKILSSRGAQR